MVVQPAPDVACVVDLQFRLKFLIRGEGGSAVQYLSHVCRSGVGFGASETVHGTHSLPQETTQK